MSESNPFFRPIDAVFSSCQKKVATEEKGEKNKEDIKVRTKDVVDPFTIFSLANLGKASKAITF